MRFMSSRVGLGCASGVPAEAGIVGAPPVARAISVMAVCAEVATGAEPRSKYPKTNPTTRQTADITNTWVGRHGGLATAGGVESFSMELVLLKKLPEPWRQKPFRR